MSSPHGVPQQGVSIHLSVSTDANRMLRFHLTSQQPPYAPQVAGVGGRPTITTDVPIASVFILLYLVSAVANGVVFRNNHRKGHKFIFNILLLQFSIARILTCALRIGSATHPTNISLSIAAGIFVNAGILMVYIINLVFAQRILRARQPELGWHPVLRAAFKVLYALIAVALVILITFIVISFYTLDTDLRQTARKVQLAGITYFLIFSVLPLLILALSYALPASHRAESFGTGNMTSKALVLAVSASLCTLGAGFKAGANWEPPRPIADPAWYQQKAAFWVFLFAIEVVILYFFLAVKIDQIFWIPDGSGKRRTYRLEAVSNDDVEIQRRASSSSKGGPWVDDDKDSLA